MRKFNNISKVTIVKHAIIGYQVALTSMFVYGFMRVLIGLIMGEFNHASIGFLQ
jgi:hypothetical protein